MSGTRLPAAVAPAFTFDGHAVPFQEGDTLGSALHRAGVRVIGRSLKYHRPRGLYCCTGSCASCLVDVEGVPNTPACMAPARDGAAVRSQNRLGSARRDLYGVVDKVYPRGFDPHAAFTRPRPLNALFLKAVRHMSGVGRAPEEARAGLPGPPPRRHRLAVHHLVVGGGLHGLRAARQHAEGGPTLLVEELPQLGGSAGWDPTEAETRRLATEAAAGAWSGVEAWTGAVAFGVYGRTVAVRRGEDLWEVEAERITLAPGRHDAWPIFANNDLPGVLSLRGARRLLHQHGVLPGRRVVVHGAPVPAAFAAALVAAGGAVVAQGLVEEARGGTAVQKARVDGRWVACDAVVCNLPGMPRAELFQQAGCRLDFLLGGLGPAVDADGRTSRPDVFAAFSPPPPAPAAAAAPPIAEAR